VQARKLHISCPQPRRSETRTMSAHALRRSFFGLGIAPFRHARVRPGAPHSAAPHRSAVTSSADRRIRAARSVVTR